MVPLDSTNIDDKLIYTRDCGCDSYCEKCSVILTLHARCTGENNVTVYARDLVVAEGAQLGSPVITGACYAIATFIVFGGVLIRTEDRQGGPRCHYLQVAKRPGIEDEMCRKEGNCEGTCQVVACVCHGV